jgi:hypothetical protein
VHGQSLECGLDVAATAYSTVWVLIWLIAKRTTVIQSTVCSVLKSSRMIRSRTLVLPLCFVENTPIQSLDGISCNSRSFYAKCVPPSRRSKMDDWILMGCLWWRHTALFVDRHPVVVSSLKKKLLQSIVVAINLYYWTVDCPSQSCRKLTGERTMIYSSRRSFSVV